MPRTTATALAIHRAAFIVDAPPHTRLPMKPDSFVVLEVGEPVAGK